MVRPLRRVVHVLVLGLLLAQASGAAQLVVAAACEASCPDDDDGGNCPPDCTACACCAHVCPVEVPALPGPVAPTARPVAAQEPITSPVAAEPRAIEHVPKPDAC